MTVEGLEERVGGFGSPYSPNSSQIECNIIQDGKLLFITVGLSDSQSLPREVE